MWRHARLRRKHAALARREQPSPLADYLSVPLPDPQTPWQQVEFLALDIETTGLDPARDAMLAVGWVVLRNARVELGTARTMLVRPETGVGQSATVHGLTDTAVREGVDVSVVLAAILTALKGRVLLVHYAALDHGVIANLCRTYFGTTVPILTADTLDLELKQRRRKHHTDSRQSLRLTDLRSVYKLPYYAAHNCLTDAIATAELLLAMARQREKDGALKLADLLT